MLRLSNGTVQIVTLGHILCATKYSFNKYRDAVCVERLPTWSLAVHIVASWLIVVTSCPCNCLKSRTDPASEDERRGISEARESDSGASEGADVFSRVESVGLGSSSA